MAETGERFGVELRSVYDGVSVWIEPDGTATNRWQNVLDRFDQAGEEMTAHTRGIYERRAAMASEWIEAYKLGGES